MMSCGGVHMLYELRFIEALHGLLLSPFADRLAVAVSFLGNGGMVWILAIVVLLLSPKTRKAGIAAAVALAAEAVNSSIEALADLVSPGYNEAIKRTKDLAAGAVLILAIGAATIGCIIFLPKFLAL